MPGKRKAKTQKINSKRVRKSIAKSPKADSLHMEPLARYFEEISKIRVLTREEEYALADRIEKGDIPALHELVKRNLKYVVTVANKYRGCGISLQDLINEGNIGMIQAAKRYKSAKHVKFITYADWWIRQAIMHALADQAGTVRLPIKKAGMLYKIGREYKKLTQNLEREPTQAEVAEDMGIEEEDVETILRAYRTHLSLNTPLKDREQETPYLELLENPNYIPYDDQIIQSALHDQINELLKDLTPREEKIIRMRFGFNGETKTLEGIGKEIGLSRERVRQIEKRAKNRLKMKSKIIAQGESFN